MRKPHRISTGWKTRTTLEFPGLFDQEAGLDVAKATLAVALRRLRRVHNISPDQLAARIGSNDSLVVRMENADPSISIEQLMQAMLAAGATMTQVAAILAARDPHATPVRRKVFARATAAADHRRA